MNYEAVIGLEVHVQIRTRSKMFSPVEAGFGREPNTLTDPVVLALPEDMLFSEAAVADVPHYKVARAAPASSDLHELERLLARLPVCAGDVFDVPAGMLHALLPGLLVWEVQQPSERTYRVADWGRDDPSRPLTVIGDGKQTRCFTYVDDAIRATMVLDKKRLPKLLGIIHRGNPSNGIRTSGPRGHDNAHRLYGVGLRYACH